MSNPNIVGVTTITGKTTATTLTASYTTQISNSAASGKIYKVNTIMVANTGTSAAYDVSLDFYRNSTSFPIAGAITVPVGASIVLVSKDTAIYLEEGDAIRAKGSTAGYLNLIGSYEEIS